MDFVEVVNAWISSINPTEDQKKKSLERAQICFSCEKNKKIAGIHLCSSCGCPISKKIFSQKFNPCPLKKWEDVDIKYMQLQKTKKTIL